MLTIDESTAVAIAVRTDDDDNGGDKDDDDDEDNFNYNGKIVELHEVLSLTRLHDYEQNIIAPHNC